MPLPHDIYFAIDVNTASRLCRSQAEYEVHHLGY